MNTATLTLRTSCGRHVDLDNPLDSLASLPIWTIAHSLAQVNRYTGHAARPNSVAEHSLLVVEILERELAIAEPTILMLGLLHDAHECITNDLASPVKHIVAESWRPFEHRWEHALHTVYALRSAHALYGTLIKRADLMARATEQRDLFPPPHEHPPAPAVDWVNLRSRDGMTWQDWRQAWADRFAELQTARQLIHGATPA